MRKGLGRTERFEVFKRDGFACQYCGAHPPQVILHVDHIVPVAEGGGNEIDNLITACQPCNQGKAARLLSSVPQSLKDKAVEVAEREAQLRGYSEVMEARRDRIEEEMWRIVETLKPGSSKKGYYKENLISIKRFLEKLDLYEVLDAAELAYAKGKSDYSIFKYFCGVCWRKIRRAEGAED